jgi:hypothetical protein
MKPRVEYFARVWLAMTVLVRLFVPVTTAPEV